MPLLLRKLDRRVRWYKERVAPWLEMEGDIPADPLADLRTTDNALSVFLVEDSRVNLDRIAVALASKRNHLKNLDYLLFDFQVISESNIEVKISKGDTLDDQVNDCHRDLVGLSGLKLVALARAILTSNYKTGRFLPEQILGPLNEAVSSGRIDREKLPDGIRDKID